MNQQTFKNWNGDQLRRILTDARITIDYQHQEDIEYLRQMVSQNFLDPKQVSYNAEKSSMDIRKMHKRYINNTHTLLNMIHALIHTLTLLKDEMTPFNEWMWQQDDWQSDGVQKLHTLLKELEQHNCAVMLIGDTGAGKSTTINAIVQRAVVPTGVIKTTGAIIELSYNATARFSTLESDANSHFVEQQLQFDKYPERPSDAIALFVANDEHHWSFVRGRLEYPLPLLKSGIVIKDAPGLNDTDQLTAAVIQDMTTCQAFICVLDRGLTKQIEHILVRLIQMGREPDSIFFVITHMDDYSMQERIKATKRIRSDLYEIDPRFNNNECLIFNPRCALEIFNKYGLHTRDYVEFLSRFTPFLGQILAFKHNLIIIQLADTLQQLHAFIQTMHYRAEFSFKTCQKEQMVSSARKEIYRNSMERMKKKIAELFEQLFTEGTTHILNYLQTPEFDIRFQQAVIEIPFPRRVGEELDSIETLNQKAIVKELELYKIYLQHEFKKCTQNILEPFLHRLASTAVQDLGKMTSEDICLEHDEKESFLLQFNALGYPTVLHYHRQILSKMLHSIKHQFVHFTEVFLSYYLIGTPQIVSSVFDVLLRRNAEALANENCWNRFRRKLSEKFRHALSKVGQQKQADQRYYPLNSLLQCTDEILKSIEQVYVGNEEQVIANTTRENSAMNLLTLCNHYIDDIIPTLRATLNKTQVSRQDRWSLSPSMVSVIEDELNPVNDGTSHIVKAKLRRNSTSEPIPVYVRRLSGDFCALHVCNQTNSSYEPAHENILHCYGAYFQNDEVFVVTEPWQSPLRTILDDVHNFPLQQRIQLAIELMEVCIRFHSSLPIDHLSLDTLVVSQDRRIKMSLITFKPAMILSHENEHDETRREMQIILALGGIFKELFMLDQNVLQIPRSLYLVVERSCLKMERIGDASLTMNWILGNLKIEQVKLQFEHLTTYDSLRTPRKRYGLLAIDGGGSRGIIAAKILETIQNAIGKPLWEVFNFGGGVSTGGLLILSTLVRQTPPRGLVSMYKSLCGKIFMPRLLPTQNYSVKHLEHELKEHFGEMRMYRHSNEAPRVFVVTKQNYDPHPYLLRNYDVPDDTTVFKGESGWLCSDAARATTAAPTFFAPFVCDGIQYTDGAMGFNNPVLLLFKEFLLLESMSNSDDLQEKERIPPIDYIVSIGTGDMDGLQAPSRPKKGLTGMFKTVQLAIELITNFENAHHQMQMLAKACGNIPYFRFNPRLPERLPLDIRTDNELDSLIKLTEEYLNDTAKDVPQQLQRLAELVNRA